MSEFYERLKCKEQRQEITLVFAGTGVNFWHYYPFLKQFSLEELSDFKNIYCISGGAVVVWCYCLSHLGLFDEQSIFRYDYYLRRLNHNTVFGRLIKLIGNHYLYDTKELASQIDKFACKKARELTFDDFVLKNFTCLAHDDLNNKLLYLNAHTFPKLNMGDALSSLTFPRKVFGRNLCRPIDFSTLYISDFEFADREIKKQFKDDLSQEANVYWLNMYQNKLSENRQYIKISTEKYIKAGQLYDFLALLIGIPNSRHHKVSQRYFAGS